MKLNFNKQAKRMRESIREEMETWIRALTKTYKLKKKK
jgi:hypothetical protein